ncbi:MAG: histidine phosphatase family protein [archaeon]
MRLYIVRHGESHANLNKISQGHFNSKLTLKGEDEARRAALKLKDDKIDYCYSSDLDRCVRTAEEILKFHPEVEMRKIPELREQSKGIYEGKPREVSQNDLEKLGQEWWEFQPEGGETMGEVWEKVIKFYEKIRSEHHDKSVLFVSHGGPISCLLSYLHGDTLQNTEKYVMRKNATISIVNIDEEGRSEFESFNYTKHLE